MYSYAQLKTLWIQAGGKASAAPVAAAIALAESGGNPNASHTNSDGSVDRGLWQINSVHGAQSTFNVAANAKAAVAISNNGATFRPWTTYTSGAYGQYIKITDLNGINPSTGDVPGDSTSVSGGAIPAVINDTPKAIVAAANSIGDVASVLEKFVASLFSSATWFRVGKVVVGLFLGLFGIIILARPLTNSLPPAVKTAAKVAAV